MMHKIFKLIAGGNALAALLFFVTAHAAQVPSFPNQGENFLRESLEIIPDNLDSYTVGGGGVAFPPSGGYKFEAKINPSVSVPPMLSCGGLDISASLNASLKNLEAGAMGALRAVQQAITTVITQFPMLAIAYISPTISTRS